MIVIKRKVAYPQDPTRYFHFDQYSKQLGDFVLMEGGFAKPLYWKEYAFTPAQMANIMSKRIVRLDFAEPTNYFVADHSDKYDDEFYKIFTLCPYTAEWLNNKFHTHKRIPIFFPVNEKYVGKNSKKTIDIIYSGHILARELKEELKILRNFNYAIISNSNDRIVTHRSVSYQQKMKLYARSKITLVHNIIFKQYLHRIVNVWLSGDWWNNKAFKQIPSPWKPWELLKRNIYVPQLKSRVFEAALSKSLILCRKDDFNVIEMYFKPNREFIYYEPGKLQESIQYILAQYPKFEKIANNAYQRAKKEYTVKAFIQKYLKYL